MRCDSTKHFIHERLDFLVIALFFQVQFMSPVVLASCVENVWYMLDVNSYKKHLSESLWLACGAQGMKVR